jgi:hypothetical protein
VLWLCNGVRWYYCLSLLIALGVVFIELGNSSSSSPRSHDLSSGRVGCSTVILRFMIPNEGEWGCIWRHSLLTAIYTRVSCAVLSYRGRSWVTRGARASAWDGEMGLVIGRLGQSGLDPLSIRLKLFYPVQYVILFYFWKDVYNFLNKS